MVLHGKERVLSKAEAERLCVTWWRLSEHTRDRGDECPCDSCAADDLDLPPLEAAIRRASLIGDRASVARFRVAMQAEARRRRA